MNKVTLHNSITKMYALQVIIMMADNYFLDHAKITYFFYTFLIPWMYMM